MGQLDRATRRDILAAALRDHGLIALAPTLDAAIDFVNAYAPEHLSVDVEPLEPTVDRLRNAGSLFVGPWAPESAGDYATGANHVLPTGGLARASGGLSVESYGKFVQVQRIDRDGLASIRADDRDAGRGRGPARAPRRRRDPLRGPRPDEPDARHVQPAERAVDLQLGGDRRGGRGPLRDRPVEHRPVRPQHLADPAGARPAPAGGRPVRGAAVRIPADRLPPPGRGGGGPLRRDRVGDPRRGRRRRDPRHRRQGVHPGRRPRRRPGPDLCDVPGPHRAARRAGRRGPATRRGGGLVARLRTRPRAAAVDAAVVWLCSPNNPTALAEPDGAIARAPRRARRGCRRGRPTRSDRRPRRGLRRIRRDRRSSGCATTTRT